MADDDDRVLIGAVDQGTSSTRFLIFDSANSELITYHQTEIKNFYPEDGWVETDPMEILNSVKLCIEKSIGNLKMLNISPSLIKAIGITNQRETAIAWDKQTGRPLYNAIVWLDTRTRQTVERLIEKSPGHNQFYLQPRCGLPISTYFSAVKMRWLLENCSEVQKAVELQRCCCGTVDSWLLWNLTGGSSGGKFFTDVTNASRTMLMNIHTLKWDPVLCKFFDIPQSVLPEIRTSSEIYGYLADTCLCGVPISGILGDQQAALVGQGCFDRGQVKNTYGTGCFVLCNTGSEVLVSDHGLVTTVAYQLGKGRAPCYALEGSVAIAGAAVRWLRENMNILLDKEEVETLALSVKDTGGCYFVPAFSGLFCPYWLSNSRGVICGLTQSTNRAHVARACLEAVCFQTKEVLDAMNRDCGAVIKSLKADGGMTNNNLLMQLQADLLGINVVRASMPETTALGAAIAAGMAEGINAWEHPARATRDNSCDTFVPAISQTERDERFCWWKMAVTKSMNWEIGQNTEQANGVTSAVPYCMYVLLSFGIYVASELIMNKR